MQTAENKTRNIIEASNKKATGKLPFFQPKLTINEPGDQYEQEADAMADKVMRMPANPLSFREGGGEVFFKPKPVSVSHLQRKCAHCEEEEKLQRKENTSQATEASSETSSYINSLSSKGSPLSESTRSFFEPRFGYDFSNIKIHNDTEAAKSAQSVNALAYTTGNNIVFNQHQFSPKSEGGKRLLAHELTHVVQQGIDSPTVMRYPEGDVSERELEMIPPEITLSVFDGTDEASGNYQFLNNTDNKIAIWYLTIDDSSSFSIELIGNNIIDPHMETSFTITFKSAQSETAKARIQVLTQDERYFYFPVEGKAFFSEPKLPVQKPVIPKVPPKSNSKAYGDYLERRVAIISDKVDSSSSEITNLIDSGNAYVDETIQNLNGVCTKYDAAFKKVQSTIVKGNGQLAEEKESSFGDILLDIAIGTVVGVLFGEFVEATLIVEAAGHAIVDKIAEKAKDVVTDSPDPSTDNSQTFLEKMNPLIGRLEVANKAVQAYRELAKLGPAYISITKDISSAFVKTLISIHHLTLSLDDLEKKVVKLEDAQKELDKNVISMHDAIHKIYQVNEIAKKDAANANERNMEFNIWLKWMAQLQGNDVNLLESDAVIKAITDIGLVGPNGFIPKDIAMAANLDKALSMVGEVGICELYGYVNKNFRIKLRGGKLWPFQPDPEPYRDDITISEEDRTAPPHIDNTISPGDEVVITSVQMIGSLPPSSSTSTKLIGKLNKKSEKYQKALSLIGKTGVAIDNLYRFNKAYGYSAVIKTNGDPEFYQVYSKVYNNTRIYKGDEVEITGIEDDNPPEVYLYQHDEAVTLWGVFKPKK